MAEKQSDPAVLVELAFERMRRFTDDWLSHAQTHVAIGANTGGVAACQEVMCSVKYPDSPLSLFMTANPAFNKLAAMLAYLVDELTDLHTEAEGFYNLLLAFGEETTLDKGPGEGDAQLVLARALPFLRALVALLDRQEVLLDNLLLQLGSLCAEHTRKATIIQGSHARTPFLVVAECLAVLVRIDAICTHNANLASAFAMSLRMLQAMAGEPQEFKAEEAEEAVQLQAELVRLQARLLGRGLFRTLLESRLFHGGEVQEACGSTAFLTCTANIIKQELAQVVGRISTKNERIGDRHGLVGLLALAIIYFRFCEDQSWIDRRLLRALLDLHQQVPLLPVASELMLQPASFLSQYLPIALDAFIPGTYARQAVALRAQQMERMMLSFEADTQHAALALASWLTRMDTLLAPQRSDEALLTKTAGTSVQGAQLAESVQQRLLMALSLLKLGGAVIDKSTLRTIVHSACLLKGVEAAYRQHQAALAEALPHLITHAKSGVQGLLLALGASVRARARQAESSQSLLSIKSKRERTVAALKDAAVAADAAVQIAKGPASGSQMTGLTLCLEAVSATETVSQPDIQRLWDRLATLRTLTRLSAAVQETTDCSFLFFNWDLLEAALSDVASHPEEARMLPSIIAAFSDAHHLLNHTCAPAPDIHQAYDSELLRALKEKVLLPTCHAAETQLRLHLHASKHIAPGHEQSWRDVTPLLRLEPIRLHTQIISLREFVGRELSASFYNYTAVALHDCQIYTQLATLAADRLGLVVLPPDLPGRALDQGLDLLEVMQALPAFVAGYAYSFTDQVFIQRAAIQLGAKHLITLGLPHVVNALRTHGASLADAVVNAAYHVLSRHFIVLSQWLFQDQVKARLAKEVRAVEEAAEAGSEPYPFASAEQLTTDLRRLGTTPDGATYLDHLRGLVTEVGNAMALVRLVRHSRLRLRATAARYVPASLSKAETLFEDAAREHCASDVTVESARVLDATLRQVSSDAMQGTDYFSVLVNVFADQRGPEHEHMVAFQAVVPALTLNAVEAGLLAKEQLAHRRRRSASAAFTDDGFYLGLAFLIKVLGQESQVDALRWFESAAAHFTSEQRQLKAAGEAASQGKWGKWLSGLVSGETVSEPDAQNRQLVLARLARYGAELQLLHNTFKCARILFCQVHEDLT